MVDVKMTNILVTTSQFLATVTYPVKIKIAEPISKKMVSFHESVNAVIEVTPIVHGSFDTHDVAEAFYNVLTQDDPHTFTKHKKRELGDLLELCGAKTRAEIAESLRYSTLGFLEDQVDRVIINFIDKSGTLVRSRTRSLEDVLTTLRHIRTKILLWKMPKKRASLAVHTPKIRRKERLEKELVKRHFGYNRKAA